MSRPGMVERHKLAGSVIRASTSEEVVPGQVCMGGGYLAVSSGKHYG